MLPHAQWLVPVVFLSFAGCLETQASPPSNQPWEGVLVQVVEGKISVADPLGLHVEEFLVHPGARITLNGKLVKLFDLRPGDYLFVLARPGIEAMGIRAVRR